MWQVLLSQQSNGPRWPKESRPFLGFLGSHTHVNLGERPKRTTGRCVGPLSQNAGGAAHRGCESKKTNLHCLLEKGQLNERSSLLECFLQSRAPSLC